MPEREAENGNQTADSSSQAGRSGGSKLPLAVGGLVFVICVVIFSVVFGVFSSSNVTQQSVVAKEHPTSAAGSAPESDYDIEDDHRGMFADDDESLYPDSNRLSPADSTRHVEWYQAQKQEIREERLALDTEKSKLRQLRDEVASLLERRAAIEDANVAAMAKLYENMDAEEVVPILSNLDNAQVSLIISKMKKRSASQVMGKLSPERAAKITQWLISLESN
jgi:flagellar motility protein MotE (MotC chaperone)